MGRKPLVSDKQIDDCIMAGMTLTEMESNLGHHILYSKYKGRIDALFPNGGTLTNGPAIDLTEGDTVYRQGGVRAYVKEITHDEIRCKYFSEKWSSLSERKREFVIKRKDYASGKSPWSRVNLPRVTIIKK